ncbi:conjugal transfer protein TraO [Porphyromonas gingivalis]|uniref:conjugal transfer protein TraO n=1 Tax=Porphyromonas gingivalis TaxID=837 RepID=UPI000BE76253|nr:conjugal transfer protein TraO [Porphyromonas gingivalis]PDP76388.1 conjugal transfer protein TraO [Porphyromonas gingivalis]
MKLKILFSSLCAALVVGLPTAVQAQRLVPSQKGLEVSASMPIVKGKSLFKQDDFGLTLSLSHYLKRGKYTFVSAGYEQQALRYRSYQVPLRDYLVQMGYAHPLLSDKGKNVFFYLGTSAVAGYEDINKGEKLLPDGAKLLDDSRWVYGASVQTSIEYFLFDRLILSAKAQLRYLFNSDVHRLRPTLGLGLRYQL